MKYVIGIDGGGTKTKAVIADMDGFIYAYATAGPTNPNTSSEKELEHTFIVLIDELKKHAPKQFAKVTTLFAGIAGTSDVIGRKKISNLIKQIVSREVSIIVELDVINALYSGTYGKPGIVQIAGTGSTTYGINQFQRRDRVGGWGYLLGDEGSGYTIGQHGIMAALKAYDGRGNKTLLLDMVYDYFQVENGEGIISRIYSSTRPKNEISSVSKLVFKAYEQNDLVAKEIIKHAGSELSIHIITLYKKLFNENEKVKLVLCGGVFTDPSILPPIIEKGIKEYQDRLSIVIPRMPPVGGSLIGALLHEKQVVNRNVVNNLIEEFTKLDNGKKVN